MSGWWAAALLVHFLIQRFSDGRIDRDGLAVREQGPTNHSVFWQRNNEMLFPLQCLNVLAKCCIGVSIRHLEKSRKGSRSTKEDTCAEESPVFLSQQFHQLSICLKKSWY